MSPAVIVLGPAGLATARLIAAALPDARVHGREGVEGVDHVFTETAPAVRRQFAAGHPIVGICAAGILIRALAPVLADKRVEPAVIAVAADGSAVVPLLGGLAGGEDLARRVGLALGVRPASTALGAIGPGAEAAQAGSLAVVGLGPGTAAWLTPEALHALRSATDIVGYGPYLERVPERPGQRRHASDNREEVQRARVALELARNGRRVAVVSSGDPGIFAMAAAVLEAVEAEPGLADGVPITVAPGLSAMQAAAARVGAPLGHDFAAISLSDNLKPWPVVEQRLRSAAEADLVLALYNPAGRARRQGLERAIAVLSGIRAGDTPVVVARSVGQPGETIATTTLGAVESRAIDMRTLLIVGSSRTRILELSDGRRFVYTPRGYPRP